MVLVAASMAVVLVLAPTADAAACATEAPAPVAAAVAVADGAAATVSDPAPAPDKGHVGGGDAICQHGHCHHTASVAAPTVKEAPLQALKSVKRLMLRSQRLETNAFSRVERPPRV